MLKTVVPGEGFISGRIQAELGNFQQSPGWPGWTY